MLHAPSIKLRHEGTHGSRLEIMESMVLRYTPLNSHIYGLLNKIFFADGVRTDVYIHVPIGSLFQLAAYHCYRLPALRAVFLFHNF